MGWGGEGEQGANREEKMEGIHCVALIRPTNTARPFSSIFARPEPLILYNAKLDTFSEPEPFLPKVQQVARSSRLREYSRLTVNDADLGAIHYELRADTNVLYVVFASKEYPQQRAFHLLKNLIRDVEGLYGAELKRVTCADTSADVDLREIVRDICVEFRFDPQISQIESDLNEVRLVMQQNISAAVAREEKLEVLVDKSDEMVDQASQFNKSSASANNKFWKQNLYYTIAIAVAVLILILVLVLVFTLR